MKFELRDELMKLTKEKLCDYIEVLTKNFWTCQNNWMANISRRYGSQIAAEFDAMLWQRLWAVQVYRFKKLFNIGDDMQALLKCWLFSISREPGLECEWLEVTDKRAVWQCKYCPMQLARRRDGMDELPCKEPLRVAYSSMAAAVNPKLKVTHVFAPPDPHTDDLWCGVTFEMED